MCLFGCKFAAFFGVTAVSPECNFTFDTTTGTIIGNIGSGGDVVIPAKIGGIPVIVIGDYAFLGCISMTSIIIPDSVTTIGNHVFRSCSSLISISIPDNVTTIGQLAFGTCSGLISIAV